METNNLSSTKFKEIVLKMFTELGRKVNEFSEDLGNKEIEKEPNRAQEYNNGNKKQTLERITTRLKDTEELISDQEDRVLGIIQTEKQRKNFFNEDRLRSLYDNINYTTGILGVKKEKR